MWMTQKDVILPFMTIMVKGAAKLMTHSKCVNVIVEPIVDYLDHIATARSYGVLTPGVGKVDICLQNHSAKQITLPKETTIGEIAATNAIPVLLVTKPTKDDFVGIKVTTK